MTRNHILKVIAWMRKSGVKTNELQFFQTAYFDIHKEANVRCHFCFVDYINTGHVPLFVRQFIRKYLLMNR